MIKRIVKGRKSFVDDEYTRDLIKLRRWHAKRKKLNLFLKHSIIESRMAIG
jgi:hypothetical protein